MAAFTRWTSVSLSQTGPAAAAALAFLGEEASAGVFFEADALLALAPCSPPTGFRDLGL